MYLIGILVIAAIIGSGANSWAVFLVVAGVLLAASIHGGDIRVSPKLPPQHKSRKNSRRRKY
ncbi:MAG TPA: hypothetical protein DD473_15945 [Planctomycetaceae bacterium]|nr:hypothetical protein [Planctomycetaceae bacterium]